MQPHDLPALRRLLVRARLHTGTRSICAEDVNDYSFFHRRSLNDIARGD